MVSSINSCGLLGIDGYIVNVECSINTGLPSFDTVGLPDVSIKEAKERVCSALLSCGFEFPLGRVVINLAPSNIKKEGSGFDLPIALAVLICGEKVSLPDLSEYAFIAELSLGGELRPVNGILPMIIASWHSGVKKVIVAEENACEAAVVKDIEVFGAANLHKVIGHLSGIAPLSPTVSSADLTVSNVVYDCDFADVKGQAFVKRALEIAAAGGHNCLMTGSPGSGKTMLAQRLPGILPDLSFEEALEVTKIHSIAGTLSTPFINTRPFRAPHHTVSNVSLAGGGRIPRPGEVSLAHNGVLFLDEFPEFSKNALEILRQPLEDGSVTISRVNATVTYPSNFMLIAAQNPCPCGYFGDKKNQCTCSPAQVQKYQSRVSGPLLDRIDLHINVEPVDYAKLTDTSKCETSAQIKERVNAAREIQRSRYKDIGIYCNADLSSKYLERFCRLGEKESAMLENAFNRLGLSARAYTKIIKTARTIADLAGTENINSMHLAEAIGYRSLDRNRFNV